MHRLTLPTLDDMKPEQRAVYAQTVAGRRGTVPANVLAWLHSPNLAARGQKLGEFVRYETQLKPRWSEMAILVVARQWTAQYEWAVHAVEAARVGVPPETIEAIAARRTPRFDDEDERTVFEFAHALASTGHVPDEVYKSALQVLGQRRLVELVGLMGYYAMVAMTLNAFEIPAPPGAPTLEP